MTKAKLLSLCLAAVLLCGCIVGFMMTGASAEETVITWTVDGTSNSTTGAVTGRKFLTVQAAVEAAAAETWPEGYSLKIDIPKTAADGTTALSAGSTKHLFYVDPQGVLFGVNTIFREDGTKLPIAIRGAGKASSSRFSIVFTTDGTTENTDGNLMVACSNDYTFFGVNFLYTDGKIFAGCGNITFDGSLLQSGKGVNVCLYGDNFTESVYRGWTQENLEKNKVNGKIETSVTFSSDYATTNLPSGTMYSATLNSFAAVGYTPDGVTEGNKDSITFINDDSVVVDVKPCDTVCTAKAYGKTRVGTKTADVVAVVGSSPVSKAILDFDLEIDKTGGRFGSFSAVAAGVTANTDIEISIANGKEAVDSNTYTMMGASSVLNGDLSVTVRSDSSTAPIALTDSFAIDGTDSKINGDCTVAFTNATISGSIAEINNVSGDVSVTIDGSGSAVTTCATNVPVTLKSGTIAAYTGAGELIVDGGTVANYKGTGTLTANSGAVGYYYDGNAFDLPFADGVDFRLYATAEEFTGDVVNNVIQGKGTPSRTIENGVMTNTLYTDSFTTFYGTGAAVTGDVTNNLTGVTVEGVFAGTGAEVIGNVVNTVTGCTFNSLYRGTNAAVKKIDENDTTNGNVTNNIKSCRFEGDGTADGYAVRTASYSAAGTLTNNVDKDLAEGETPTYIFGRFVAGASTTYTNIVNNIYNGTFDGYVYFGTFTGSTVSGGVTNTIRGGTFKDTVYLNCYDGVVNGTSYNNIYGGTFTAKVYTAHKGSLGYTNYDGTYEPTKEGLEEGLGIFTTIGEEGKDSALQPTFKNVLHLGGAGWTPAANASAATIALQNKVAGVKNVFYGGTFANVYCGGVYGIIGDITNIVYDGKFTARFLGGSNAESATVSSITNTIYGGTFDHNIVFGGDSAVTGNITSTISPTGIFSWNKAILAGTSTTGTATIKAVGGLGGTFVIGDTAAGALALDELDTTNGALKLSMAADEGWVANQVYLTAPADIAEGAIVTTQDETAYGAGIVEGKEVKGFAVEEKGVAFVLTDRIALRFYFDKVDIETLQGLRDTTNPDLKLVVKLDGTTLTDLPLKYDSDNQAYYQEVSGITPKDFALELTYYSKVAGGWTEESATTVDAILADAELIWTDEALALAKSLRALGDANYEYAPVIEESKSDTFSCTFGDDTTFVATDVGIVMGDAVGITIYGTGETSDLKVIVNGNEAPFTATADYIDIFVNIANARNDMKIEIRSAEGKTCFELTTSVEKAAARYPESHQRYVDVQKVLAYIQAADAYKAAQA